MSASDEIRERLIQARADRQRALDELSPADLPWKPITYAQNVPLKVEPLTLTVSEAAHLIGISRRHAYELVANGEIPSVRFGKAIRIPRTRLMAMIEGRAV